MAAIMLSHAMDRRAAAQPCNPVIDGTYCAEQMSRPRTSSMPPRPTMSPIEEIGGAVSVGQDNPATFGAVSFRYGSACMGLMRRGNCN